MNIQTANRLCELRKAAGLSQEELADRLGVSRQAVSKWERGESSPDTDNLIELAKIYGVTIDELINGDGTQKTSAGKGAKNRRDDDDDDDEDDEDEDDEDDDDDDDDDDEGGIHAGVIIDNTGIHISKGKKKVEITDDGVKVNDEGVEQRKESRIGQIIYSTYSIIVTIAYLLLGFLLPNGFGWSHFWFLFITIPVIGSVRECFRKRRIKSFNYPCFVTALFCALGMFLGLWHPAWVLFITIPIFYIIADIIEKK